MVYDSDAPVLEEDRQESPEVKATCKERIIEKLMVLMRPLAVHEFDVVGRDGKILSQNNIATRLSEMTKKGDLKTRYRDGKSYKEWYLSNWHDAQWFIRKHAPERLPELGMML